MSEPRSVPARNPLLWIGPLIAIAGFFSYWGFFVRWPFLRDTGLLNLGLLLLALTLSGLGLRRAWPAGGWRRLAGLAGSLVTALLLAGFIGYVYFLSYGLPSTEGVVAEGESLPAMVLAAHDGSSVDVSRTGGGPVVLVFYRGFW